MALTTITTALRIANAKDFIASLNTSNYYFGLGRVSPWAETYESPSASDISPPTAVDTQSHSNFIWRNAIGLKKMSTNDAMLAIARYDWQVNTLYVQYDSNDADLVDKQFYVMTSTFDVFKCIYNNNGANSTIEPTIANPTPADGYIWRFMYSVPIADQSQFLMADYIPITNTPATPVVGEIVTVKVTDGGSGYTAPPVVTIYGNGTGATATATLDGDSVDEIIITNAGSGYSYAIIDIVGDGTGAEATPNYAPNGGHGSNPIYELFAKFMILSVSIIDDEDGAFITNNDFRQAFIVKDPYLYGTTNVATIATSNQTTRVILNNPTTSFTQDQLVDIKDGASTVGTAVVAYNDTANNTLYLTNVLSPQIVDTYTINNGTDFVISDDSVSNPAIQPYSGTVLFVLNRTNVNRNSGQTETFRIPFEW